ncbi:MULTISPECIES: LCP family protein [Actinosynnema]|uniref:LCP family protein n=1 Tax=Actinosynnema TaxID=40566 RepID=UPI0020A26EED|nr:LCP family protein [Actinosynnema pretiosum]MCP2099644.1 transcriptional attenuator, LytR family [Actinosynnema pretiosum]
MKAVVAAGRTALALLSVVVLVVTGYGWSTLRRVQESVNTTDVLTSLADVPNAPPADDGAIDLLLVGSDSRTDAQGNPLPASVLRQLRTEATDTLNTDTIIVLRVPRDGSRAHAVSIPRDTYVPIPGDREEKINGAYGVTKFRTMERLQSEGVPLAEREKRGDQAGRAALVQVVQELTGVRVDHYAEVNLYGFYRLTEVIGGVDVCLKEATSDPDSGANFRAGAQTLSGGDALAFVRQRKNLPSGDLSRITRQQVFLSSAMSKLLTAGTFADPSKLSGLLEAVSKSVVVDDGLDVATLAGQLGGISGGNVEFATIPVTAVGAVNDRGQSVVLVDREQVKAFVARTLGEKTPSATTPAPSDTAPTTSDAAPTTTERFSGGKVVALDGTARWVVQRQALQQGPPCVD